MIKTLFRLLLVPVLLSGCAQNPGGGIPPMKQGLAYRWQETQRLHNEGKISDAQFYDMKFRLQAEEDAIDRQGQMIGAQMFQNDLNNFSGAMRGISRGNY